MSNQNIGIHRLVIILLEYLHVHVFDLGAQRQGQMKVFKFKQLPYYCS